jgi:hypothetical protein
MDNKEAKALLEKYRAGNCTPEEQRLLDKAFLNMPVSNSNSYSEDEYSEWLGNIWNRLAQNTLPAQPKQVRLWPRIAGIAAAVIGLAVCIYFFSAPRHQNAGQGPALVKYANDIDPGKNTAILVVNGKQTQLSDAKAGIVVNDDIKYNDGTQVSSSALGMTEGVSRALEVITPRGGTYSIILQDGTKVWLNADSKLEVLPIFWNKTQRLVRLTGEGYFEVAKVFSPGRAGRGLERVPFIVESQGQRVEVLGTHFNVSAYKGEAIRTTLLEGSVKVNETMLKPNQQSLITQNGSITVTEANPNATAWVDGKFRFQKTPLQDVLKEMARWYDVEIVYPDGIPNENLSGGINRDINLSEALYIMKNMHVKFRIEGKKIIVSK